MTTTPPLVDLPPEAFRTLGHEAIDLITACDIRIASADAYFAVEEINIGMAVALDDGLIVPVIKRADELSLAGLARLVNDLAQRARSNTLAPDEVQGGTFTVTNMGSCEAVCWRTER